MCYNIFREGERARARFRTSLSCNRAATEPQQLQQSRNSCNRAATELQQSCNSYVSLILRVQKRFWTSAIVFEHTLARIHTYTQHAKKIRGKKSVFVCKESRLISGCRGPCNSVCCMRPYNKRCVRPYKGCIQPYKRLPGAYFKASYTES